MTHRPSLPSGALPSGCQRWPAQSALAPTVRSRSLVAEDAQDLAITKGVAAAQPVGVHVMVLDTRSATADASRATALVQTVLPAALALTARPGICRILGCFGESHGW
jgi:hypothetical protein